MFCFAFLGLLILERSIATGHALNLIQLASKLKTVGGSHGACIDDMCLDDWDPAATIKEVEPARDLLGDDPSPTTPETQLADDATDARQAEFDDFEQQALEKQAPATQVVEPTSPVEARTDGENEPVEVVEQIEPAQESIDFPENPEPAEESISGAENPDPVDESISGVENPDPVDESVSGAENPQPAEDIGLSNEPEYQQSSPVTFGADTYNGNSVAKACDSGDSRLGRSERILISAVGEAFHGTSALEQVLMSSKSLATLCSCKTWQCEAKWLPGLQDSNAFEWDYKDYLGKTSACWNLHRKVFFHKFMLGDSCPSVMLHEYDTCRTDVVNHLHSALSNVELPQAMVSRGIQHITPVYIFLWRPLCLAQLSTHVARLLEKYLIEKVAMQEIMFIEQMMSSHRGLTEQGVPVLVVSLADLIWNPERNRRRLQEFLPCLGELDMDFVPSHNIIEGNMFKADGSVKDYGEHVSPKEIYDLEAGKCAGSKSHMLLETVNANWTAREHEASLYLQGWS